LKLCSNIEITGIAVSLWFRVLVFPDTRQSNYSTPLILS
jgi:hypothetical protein